MKDYLYIDSSDDSSQARFKVSETSKIDALIEQKRFSDALREVDNLLKSNSGWENWNYKGIILDNLARYGEAVECFNNALRIEKNSDIELNMANCLYNWAKVTFFPEGDYDKALKLINCALDAIPENIDPSEFHFLKAEILEGQNNLVEAQKSYLIAYKEFDKLNEFEYQTQYLNETSDTLINIVGSDFYSFTPQQGIVVDLVKDEENEHDSDAIAVIKDGKTVGYVANNPYTLIDEVKSASDIKNIINPSQKAEILFIYLAEYVIAKLID